MPYISTTGTLFGDQANRIQEILNKNIEVFLPSLDPAWRDTTVTSQGVGPANLIGKDMKILKIYMGSMAGIFEGGANANFTMLGDTVTDVAAKFSKQSLTQTWPDPTDGALAKPYRLGVQMKAMVSNLLVTMGEMQAEATPAFIGEVIAPKLEGHARLIAHTLCNYWYMQDNTNFTLGAISSIADLAFSTNTTFNFIPSNLNIDRYAVGMRIDIWTSAGSTRRNEDGSGNRVSAYVTAVDEILNRVYVTVLGLDLTGAGVAVTNGDTLRFANSAASEPAGFGIAGINSWLKYAAGTGDSAFLLGPDRDSNNQINVNTHPEFRSFYKSGVGTLTEHKLRQYLRGFHRAKEKYGQYIDCLIASDGVWLNYEAQKIGQYQLDRTSRLSSLTSEGSQEGFKFTFDGRTYTGYTSNYIESGTVYGLRKGGQNWKKYVPPSPKGTQKFDKAESFIPFEFVAPALGYSSIKVPITKPQTSTGIGLLTEGAQMPGMLRMQLVPDQPAGMRLDGVTEDRQYGATS